MSRALRCVHPGGENRVRGGADGSSSTFQDPANMVRAM